MSLVIPKSNVLIKRKHIPTTFTRDDIDKIINCIDLASPVGKRDYAIIMLVARTGIRTSDVISLKFDNIKWDKNCIQLVQYKTNEPLVLPLFEDVGRAIIDYVQNGRPASNIENVFISHKPPFQKFSKNNHLYSMFNKYLYRSGIQITPEKNHGLHTLRHSLATELMRKDSFILILDSIATGEWRNSCGYYEFLRFFDKWNTKISVKISSLDKFRIASVIEVCLTLLMSCSIGISIFTIII